MRKFLYTDLCGECSPEQMNPLEQASKEGITPQHETVVDNVPNPEVPVEPVDQLPEQDAVVMRVAVFEAVVDEVVEDQIDEALKHPVEGVEEGVVDDKQIVEKVTPMVEKAIALHIVPSFVRNSIPKIVAKHLRQKDPRTRLLAKTAHYLMEAATEVDEVLTDNVAVPIELDPNKVTPLTDDKDTPDNIDTVPEHNDDKPKLSARALFNKYMNGEISKEEMDRQVKEAVEPTIENPAYYADDQKKEVNETPVVTTADVEVKTEVTHDTAAALRYLASSALNHRAATVAVSRRLSGPMLSKLMHQLRYCLPEDFAKKYHV